MCWLYPQAWHRKEVLGEGHGYGVTRSWAFLSMCLPPGESSHTDPLNQPRCHSSRQAGVRALVPDIPLAEQRSVEGAQDKCQAGGAAHHHTRRAPPLRPDWRPPGQVPSWLLGPSGCRIAYWPAWPFLPPSSSSFPGWQGCVCMLPCWAWTPVESRWTMTMRERSRVSSEESLWKEIRPVCTMLRWRGWGGRSGTPQVRTSARALSTHVCAGLRATSWGWRDNGINPMLLEPVGHEGELGVHKVRGCPSRGRRRLGLVALN